MHYNGFKIEKPIGNNVFSFDQRSNKKLYVPKLIEGTIDDIKLGVEIVFEDFDFNGKLSSCTGLENFYKIKWNNKDLYLFDNHNHAYYFWYLARSQAILGDNNTLVHIDEHADTRDPEEYLMKPESENMEKVFEYTNFSNINVGNYIIPAQKEGLIGEVIQIRNEMNLHDYMNNVPKGNIILNLDLDFFQPDLDFIDYELKKSVVLDAANKASIITVATSPFFIDQELAIKVFKDIFSEL